MPDKNSDNKALWMVVVILMAIVVIVFALNPSPGYRAAAQQTTLGEQGNVVVDAPEGERTAALDNLGTSVR